MPLNKNIFHIQFTPKWFPTILFGFLILTYNFQHFLNFFLPVSLKWFSILFLCYIYVYLFLVLVYKLNITKFDWLFFVYFIFLLYTTGLLAKGAQISNVVGFLNINLPFLCYFFIRAIKYEKKFEFFFYLNLFFLCIVVFYGIYEYFYAQDILRILCIQFGHGADAEWPYNSYYRSVSFIMNYVHFSYYGLLLYLIFLIRAVNKNTIASYILLLLAFAGLCTSIGLTTILLAGFFSVYYILFSGKISQKLGLFLFIAIVCAGLIYLYYNYKDSIEIFQRIDMMKSENKSGHDFVFISQLLENLLFFGTGSFSMVFEQEYFDAWQRFGVIMGTLYLIVSLGIYFRACRIAIKFKEMQLYSIPIALYCISNVFIGFVHHTIDNTNQYILVFSFIAMLENRYKRNMNHFDIKNGIDGKTIYR